MNNSIEFRENIPYMIRVQIQINSNYSNYKIVWKKKYSKTIKDKKRKCNIFLNVLFLNSPNFGKTSLTFYYILVFGISLKLTIIKNM